MDSNKTPIDIAKEYVKKEYPLMSDGNFSMNTHNPQHDLQFVDHIDGVEPEHLDNDLYHVVTVQKDRQTEDNNTISSSIKIKVDKDNNIQQVLMSKSF